MSEQTKQSCPASFPVDYEALDREFNEKCWQIKKLKQNILELEAEIDACHDMRNSPQHVYLHEAIMFNIEKLDEIADNNWEEMLELKTQATKFGYNMMERLEIRISNNEQLESFQNGPKVVITPSLNESELSSLEDDYTFTRKIENNIKFHARKVEGYKDISKYFQPEQKAAKIERKRLKSEDAETQTDEELNVQVVEEAPIVEIKEAEVDRSKEVKPDASEPKDTKSEDNNQEDPNDILDKIPEEAKQRRRSSAKEIVKKLERSTSIEERFQQVTVKNTSVDILKYFQPQKPKQEDTKLKNESVEPMPKTEEPKQTRLVQENEVELLEENFQIQDDKDISDYFQRHKSLDEMEDVDDKFEQAFAQLSDEVDERSEKEQKPKLSVRERVKRMNSTVGQNDNENMGNEENGIKSEESPLTTETYIDENHNEEIKSRLSVKERIKRMNEGKLEENAEEKDVQNRIDQDEVAHVQLNDLKKYFEKPGFPLVFK